MIRKMRIKFIAITMSALFLLLVSMLISTNIAMEKINDGHVQQVLVDLVEREGALMPQHPDSERQPPPPQGRDTDIASAVLKIDSAGNIMEILDNGYDMDQETAAEFLAEVIEQNSDIGEIGQTQYMAVDKDYGRIIAFADKSIQDVMLTELRQTSYVIGSISMVLLSLIVFFLSRFVTEPIETAFEKQKRFVSDSGHELKTPLSILSANVDLMELEMGQNKWLTQIKEQTKRMNKLIHELLTLAKTEDMKTTVRFIPFNLSETMINTVLLFDVLAYEQGKQIEYDIPEDIHLNGSEKNIKEMLEALMDNAIKYSESGSTVKVALALNGSKKIISVQNKGQSIGDEEKDKLFEKFYRLDDSRARDTGGYGLGLSIVKNIVDMHKGKIDIENKTGGHIVFKVTLS